MKKNERDPVIVGAARTPIGKLLGALSVLSAPQLGAIAIREAIRRAGIDPSQIDEVIMGEVVQAGSGMAPARQAAVLAGIPVDVGAVTVNKVCGSGLKAIMLAAQAIKAGDADLVVAGGMESMSNAPHLIRLRAGMRYGHLQAEDSLIADGLRCPFNQVLMGELAEFIADQFEVTREEMDAFALESHRKAIAAIDSGKFEAEIVSVEVPDGKGGTRVVNTDEGPRRDTSMEALARLRPAFRPNGRVTAGNSPGLNDGAAAVVVMSRAKAEALGIPPIARIVGYTQAAVDPQWLFYAPAKAIPRLLERVGWRWEEVDLIEINEAFAAQVLADARAMERQGYRWDWSKVNVNGGAIALGHPVGASGARILVTLLYALRDRGMRRGIATLCLGGGEAVAMAVELE
ncbi:acetyl-CoA C-acetyltransferase [Thermoflexus sp.]|uniref:acetyl-CoA C-acetyltransferase n=1 Tax=Thermoflexus sp. TaxID=1969742 RepID=UPI0035E45BC7